MSRFIPSLRPTIIIDVLVVVWALAMGMPNVLVVDSGRSYQGEEWRQICDLYNFIVVTCPTKAHCQCGIAEKHGPIISRPFEATLRSKTSTLSEAQILARICVAENTTALSHCPIAPITLLTGRADYAGRMMNSRNPSTAEVQESDPLRQYWGQIQLILSYRNTLIKHDAEAMLKLAASKNLRTGVQANYVHNQAVQFWGDVHKCWENGYRYLSDIGRNALIGHNGEVLKMQMQWIRANVLHNPGAGELGRTVSFALHPGGMADSPPSKGNDIAPTSRNDAASSSPASRNDASSSPERKLILSILADHPSPASRNDASPSHDAPTSRNDTSSSHTAPASRNDASSSEVSRNESVCANSADPTRSRNDASSSAIRKDKVVSESQACISKRGYYPRSDTAFVQIQLILPVAGRRKMKIYS